MSARRAIAARSAVVLLSAVVVVLAGLVQPALPQAGASIDPKVSQQVSKDGKATFWVVLHRQADLSAAPAIRDWAARGTYVADQLRSVANADQKALRALLNERGVSFRAYWIVNSMVVLGGDRATLDAIAARPEVAQILPNKAYPLHQDRVTGTPAAARAVEWNIARIKADQVWNTYGIRGAGVVVSNLDTGVYWKHRALRAKYRGVDINAQTVDHNYNWWDGTGQCPRPRPCDNSDHGTHTMGTMVGDDGGANQIGVAPEAKFMMAKGCGVFFCQTAWLMSAGQFILSPTDLQGGNPRPDLRPNIVNNSWGGGPGDPFYQGVVNSWVASGIFPAFSAGNSGPGCQTAGSPGDYANTYASGAFDINNSIASFSSRGQSAFGGIIKPNIAAPGVGVRSSIPSNGYAEFDGTSMASPHVAGTVALMWSANPAMIGDISGTSAVLDDTADDHGDNQCGGTTDDNNVWGEGMLNAFDAVTAVLP